MLNLDIRAVFSTVTLKYLLTNDVNLLSSSNPIWLAPVNISRAAERDRVPWFSKIALAISLTDRPLLHQRTSFHTFNLQPSRHLGFTHCWFRQAWWDPCPFLKWLTLEMFRSCSVAVKTLRLLNSIIYFISCSRPQITDLERKAFH